MKLYSFQEHLLELKIRLLRIFTAFIIIFAICYYFSDNIYSVLLKPLAKLSGDTVRNIIYTGLTEAFFTYIKLAAFTAFTIIIPIIALECYLFISPGLHRHEKKIIAFILFMSPILFWCGSIFVFYFVMPKAWNFFLSFEKRDMILPIVLEARISEYLNLVIHLIIAFGVAFQLPVVIMILNILKIVKVQTLKQKRCIAVVINFIIAGILTPPDILSQFALAIPLLLLYETSIIICNFIEKLRTLNVKYQMD
ncbi:MULTISPECIES: twin-arginine translocase subunit TatC [spotted fever group]|uniref:Sec-independent protein translocase protein TatC n=1 Tax=Rickettsia philipii (strain 364D) TaxID=481009 RepID=H6PVB4_RICP3|nr:twin-arginine translocase subunit TatC [Rickettsia philipii]AFB26811.1 Sec-independent protein translocase protein TatC [Rickettsia philipii str. 364D]